MRRNTCWSRPVYYQACSSLVRPGCGISHPCTAFDRWRAMPVVDDDYNVVGSVRTFF